MKRFPSALILLFLFFLPWQTRWIVKVGELAGGPWEYGTISVYASLILLAAALIANCKTILRKIKEQKNAPWLWFLALFVIFSGISALWAERPEAAFAHAAYLLAGALFIVLIWGSGLSFSAASSAFVLGAAFQAALGVYQFAAQKIFASTFLGIAAQTASVPGVSVVEWAGGRLLRAYGGLPHPNILGGFLAAALILGLILFIREEVRGRHVFWMVMLMVILTGLFLSFSRSAWLAAAFGIMVAAGELVYFYRDRTRIILSAVIPILLVAILYSFLAIGPVSERFYGDSRLEANSRQERVSSIGEAFVIIKENPFFGVGAGNYTAALHRIEPGRNFWEYQPVHNAPLLVLSELGIAGLIFAILFVFSAFKQRRNDFVSALAVVWLFLALFDHYLWSLFAGIMLTSLVFGLVFLSEFSNEKTALDKI